MSFVTGQGIIFMMHRVLNSNNDTYSPNKDLGVNSLMLEKFIIGALEKKYNFVSINKLIRDLNFPKKEKQICITLDDGYLDNFRLAYPIFKKYNVPFTIYITTSFPDQKGYLWWLALEEFVNKENISTSNINNQLALQSKKLKKFNNLRNLIMENQELYFKNRFENLFEKSSVNWKKMQSDNMLKWKDIKKLSKDNLCTIGAHTINHFKLSSLNLQKLKQEILGSKIRIESVIKKEVVHFSYPFGGRGEAGTREFNLVKDLGFKSATTTRWGNIYKRHKNYLYCLPRIPLTNSFTWQDYKKKAWKRFLKGPFVTL